MCWFKSTSTIALGIFKWLHNDTIRIHLTKCLDTLRVTKSTSFSIIAFENVIWHKLNTEFGIVRVVAFGQTPPLKVNFMKLFTNIHFMLKYRQPNIEQLMYLNCSVESIVFFFGILNEKHLCLIWDGFVATDSSASSSFE